VRLVECKIGPRMSVLGPRKTWADMSFPRKRESISSIFMSSPLRTCGDDIKKNRFIGNINEENKMKKPVVGIIMGSDSDLSIMEETAAMLKKFNIQYEMKILSAHRCPEKTAEYAKNAKKNGIKVIVAGAGGAAHLAGVIAGHTILPVIGVPKESKLSGLDSLLSIVQMPSGVPVATVAIGKAGAINAGILAAQIIAVSDANIAEKLEAFKKELIKKVEKKNKALAKRK